MKNITSVLALVLPLFTAACGPSLSSMHTVAQAGSVQEAAPLHARHNTLINASPEVVWSVLTDIDAWPAWQPSVSAAKSPPNFEVGATFTWTNNGSDIESQLARVSAPRQLAWTGSVSLAKAIHVWRLSEPSPGTTRVEVEETMDGLALTWFYSQEELDADVAQSLGALKTASEKRARTASSDAAARQ